MEKKEMSTENVLQFGHIGLSVTDLEQSRHFYETILGFEVMQESHEEDRKFLFLGDGAQVFLTLWQQGDGYFNMKNPGLHHLAFKVDSMDQVKAFQQKLRENNIDFEYPTIVPHGPGADSGGIFFYDPDGIRLEIFSPKGAKAL
jgi:catechol 2,3-dioxygenase-like lactoylglutathione lyase family enzyme